MKNEAEILEIITFSGDARNKFLEAISHARQGDWEKVKQLVRDGNDNLTKAHRIQTDLIQGELRGEEVELSLLMVHAQDHLMNAITVKELSKEIIENLKMLKGER